MHVQSPPDLKVIFAKEEKYRRKRLAPQPSDAGYLHRADLLLALKSEATSENITVLDYGAGVSPYRSLFPNSDYRRADIESIGDPEYLIDKDGTIPEKSHVFDVVLSTQVLEHVSDPYTYLAECFRLLKPGGKLLLTTHGSYEDHGCPYDFQRWTAYGLERDLKKVGFELLRIEKLTTGPRAIISLLERFLDVTSISRKSFFGFTYWIIRIIFRSYRHWIYLKLDKYCSENRMVPSYLPNHNIYIAIFCCANRPL